jgi:UV DNA damage endonuclease
MTDIRLGYACINMALSEGPKNQKICVNKSCVAKTFREKGINYAVELAKNNLRAVLEILKWNEKCGIRIYRMSSDMFPHLTNPEFIHKNNNFAYPLDLFDYEFNEIGKFARKHGHRLTMHPDMFCQVGAKNYEIFKKTERELAAHAEILDKINAQDPVMVVHGGGVYGDKEKTINRWIDQFAQLPLTVQNKLVIENCERQYNYIDVLRMSKSVKRPVVFDTHHHACYSEQITLLPDPSKFLHKIVKTWKNSRPKFHISEQAPDKRIGAHSNLVKVIPKYLLDLNCPIDIIIEAKYKEQATLRLYQQYFDFNDDTVPIWTIKGL